MATTEQAQPRVQEFIGVSSTGTKHGLRVELLGKEGIRFTVTGANGKRHAAVKLDQATLEDLADFFGSPAASLRAKPDRRVRRGSVQQRRLLLVEGVRLMAKVIKVQWTEHSTYKALVEVPDDFDRDDFDLNNALGEINTDVNFEGLDRDVD